MLKKQIELLISEQASLKLLNVEQAYVQKHALLPDGAKVEEATLQFDVIERCNKETEELVAEEAAPFLANPTQFLKQHPEEFLYAVSDRLDVIRIEEIVLEYDEAFGVYSALFGLRLQKKQGEFLHTYLTTNLQHEKIKYSAAFSGADGLWEVNMVLDAMDGFSEQQSFDEVLSSLYHFIFALLEKLEEIA
ncbi:MAG: branched-chain amino acid aminotransferase [Lysinibacillus sp.]